MWITCRNSFIFARDFCGVVGLCEAGDFTSRHDFTSGSSIVALWGLVIIKVSLSTTNSSLDVDKMSYRIWYTWSMCSL